MLATLTSSATASFAANEESSARPAIHPTLETLPDSYFGDRSLTDVMVGRTCQLFPKTQHLKLMDTSFEKAEVDSALIFGERAKGKTKDEIVKILGRPKSTGGPSPAEPNTAKDEEHWLYVYGLTPILLRLNFKDRRCVKVRANPYYFDSWYWEWRENQLKQHSIGKSLQQLECLFGPPTFAYHAKGEKENPIVDEVPYEIADSKNYLIVYKTGTNSSIAIEMVDGLCVKCSAQLVSGRGRADGNMNFINF